MLVCISDCFTPHSQCLTEQLKASLQQAVKAREAAEEKSHRLGQTLQEKINEISFLQRDRLEAHKDFESARHDIESKLESAKAELAELKRDNETLKLQNKKMIASTTEVSVNSLDQSVTIAQLQKQLDQARADAAKFANAVPAPAVPSDWEVVEKPVIAGSHGSAFIDMESTLFMTSNVCGAAPTRTGRSCRMAMRILASCSHTTTGSSRRSRRCTRT